MEVLGWTCEKMASDALSCSILLGSLHSAPERSKGPNPLDITMLTTKYAGIGIRTCT